MCSTEVALSFHRDMKCSLDNANVVGAVFLDFEKTFDTVKSCNTC